MKALPGQNDPTELLEVLDAQGAPTGQAKARAAIHLDGDWHRAFHCWIVRPGLGGAPEVILQRRALTKDTFPGRWDATAAGHWRFGEHAAQAAREIWEEIGLEVPFDRLVPVGRERTACRHLNGLVDRELHEVYLLRWDAPLVTYRPDPREVSGLAAVRAVDLEAMVAGTLTAAPATEAVELTHKKVVPAELMIWRSELVPYSVARIRRLLVRGTPICA